MARTWFTKENSQIGDPLDKYDLSILNLAARRWADMNNGEIRHLDLVILRTTYKRGMSAKALLEAAGAT